MNERIRKLIMQAVKFRLDPDSECYEAQVCPEDLEYLAELIVRMCADAADMYEGNGYYVGDCVAEYMGYGAEEGVTEWRSK